jgi:hypothetical protein
VDNKNESKGFWYGKTKKDLNKTSGGFNHHRAAEGETYSSHFISDKDRAVFLRAFRSGERKITFSKVRIVADPRFDFFILKLEDTPKPPIMQYLELTDWVDSKIVQLRSVLIDPVLPAPFESCIEWCLDTAEELEEEGVEYIEPDKYRVLDSIVSWAVTDFELGCQHYIARDVLFHDALLNKNPIQNRKGWDYWSVCK